MRNDPSREPDLDESVAVAGEPDSPQTSTGAAPDDDAAEVVDVTEHTISALPHELSAFASAPSELAPVPFATPEPRELPEDEAEVSAHARADAAATLTAAAEAQSRELADRGSRTVPVADLEVDGRLAPALTAARAALAEVVAPEQIGELRGAIDEGDGVFSLLFGSREVGYADWTWTVSMSQLVDAETPNVLECELQPTEGSLLAPPWMPWADRLAEFRATHDRRGNPLADDDEADDDGDEPEPGDADDDSNDADIERAPAKPRSAHKRSSSRSRTRTRRRLRRDRTPRADS